MGKYYLGLDVHKVRTQYCLTDEGGAIVKEGNVATEDVATLADRTDLRVVLEATGNWCAVYDPLTARGADVTLAHPARIKAIASAKIKTDKIDARILAHLLRADLIPESWAPPAEVRNLRDLVRLRWSFIAEQTSAKNRIQALLAREGLRYGGSDLFGNRGRSWLQAQMLRVHVRSLVDRLLEHIERTHQHAEALTGQLRELLAGHPAAELLMTIPGVGFITAATLIAELGDWHRFRESKQVSAYFGLVPSVRASARTARYGHLTKSGSAHARRALVEAAHVAVRLPGPARQRYLSLVRRRGKKVAMVAAARTLLVLSWTLLVRGAVYRHAA
jgi:transposase